MSADKELADRVVALLPDFYDWGDKPGEAPERYGANNWPVPKIAHDFVRDWRVAGGLMEKMDYSELAMQIKDQLYYWENVTPRAITEAVTDGLEADK